MLVHYIEYFYPGIMFAESSAKQVDSRDRPDKLPEHCQGYRFFDREEQVVNGETLKGPNKNYSGHFWRGKEVTEEEIKHGNSTLQTNCRVNGYKRLVRTPGGAVYPLEPDDVVIAA